MSFQEAKFRIVIVEDNDFEDYNFAGQTYKKLVINESNDYTSESHITPMFRESAIGMETLKYAMLCRRDKKKVITAGSTNFLPLFSMFSDELLLQDISVAGVNEKDSRIYFNNLPFKALPTFQNIEVNALEPKFRMDLNNAFEVYHCLFNFASPVVFINKKHLDLFDKLKDGFPENVFIGEVNLNYERFISLIDELEAKYGKKILGYKDKTFQKDLVALAGDGYATMQLLGSLYKGWKFVSAAGSANFFSLFPVNVVFGTETPHLNFETELMLKTYNYDRYGNTCVYERACLKDRTHKEPEWKQNVHLLRMNVKLLNAALEAVDFSLKPKIETLTLKEFYRVEALKRAKEQVLYDKRFSMLIDQMPVSNDVQFVRNGLIQTNKWNGVWDTPCYWEIDENNTLRLYGYMRHLSISLNTVNNRDWEGKVRTNPPSKCVMRMQQ